VGKKKERERGENKGLSTILFLIATVTWPLIFIVLGTWPLSNRKSL
jgi:cytochrome oxidase assembly protein ShyY1